MEEGPGQGRLIASARIYVVAKIVVVVVVGKWNSQSIRTYYGGVTPTRNGIDDEDDRVCSIYL